MGGTAWFWCRPELAEAVDVLVIDEAGQFSLTNAVAVARAAKSLVLLPGRSPASPSTSASAALQDRTSGRSPASSATYASAPKASIRVAAATSTLTGTPAPRARDAAACTPSGKRPGSRS